MRGPFAALLVYFLLLQALVGAVASASMAAAAADPLGPHAVRCNPFSQAPSRSDQAPNAPACCSAACGMACAIGAALPGRDATPAFGSAYLAPRPAETPLRGARSSGDRRLAYPRAPPELSLTV
ncbi:hypothetical protein HNS03_06195 [Amorphus sp. 3PC139-8]